ncbi:MAG TPA: hypothetical protein VII06_10695 [Chloroflexota bacterium]|jgi:hypothetical protein
MPFDEGAWLELQDWVSQLRGLPLLRPVPLVQLDPDAFRARQAEVYRAYLDPADLERTGQLLVGLGLLDPDDDLASLLVDLYSALPIGFYDPLDGVIYARASADPQGPLERVILAHEFTHALQDQHFGVLHLYQPGSANADRDQAVSALLEGDALIVQEMYVATTQPDSPEEQAVQAQAYQQSLQQVYVEARQALPFPIEAVPQPVIQQVYAPYLDGPGFIHEVVGTPALTTFGAYGPAVERLFRRPPQSTAEILHPDKYRRGWRPTPVELPDLTDALGGDWRLLRHQVIGELEHRSLLARDLPPDEAEAAAAGWAGNRAEALVDDAGQMATVSATRWESVDAAATWASAFAAAIAARYGDAATLLWSEQGRQIWRAADQAVLLEVQDARSLVVQAPTVDDAEALADAAQAHRPPDLRATLARLLPVP